MITGMNRKRAILSLLVLAVIINLLTFFNPLPLLCSSLLLIVLLILPGILLLLAINRSTPRFSVQNFLTAMGLSLTFLIFGGLFINTIGPLIGIDRPLSRIPLLITLDILGIILAVIALYRHKNIKFEFKNHFKFKKLDILFISFGIVCLLLILGGSQILNNGGSGALVLCAIVGIAGYIILGILFHKKLNPTTLPIAIFLFSFSLILSYSLRSNYVFGWDINQEFHVFQLANNAKHWIISSDRGPYNACLSITILPTVLASITRISGAVLFKIIFQGIFALVPLAIYELTRIILPNKDRRLGFLAAAIFASQTWFIMQAPILVRQEIALFFFSIFLIILLSKKTYYRFYIVLFGLMIILSHYSTAYVMLALLAIYTVVRLGLVFRNHPKLFSVRLLLILFIITFLWQYQMTKTAGNLNSTIKQTVSTLPQVFSSEGIGASVSQITFSNPNLNTQQNITSDYQTQTKEYEKQYTDLYPRSTYTNYQAHTYPKSNALHQTSHERYNIKTSTRSR